MLQAGKSVQAPTLTQALVACEIPGQLAILAGTRKPYF